MADIVQDFMQRLAQLAPEVPAQTLQRLEVGIRQDWGGTEPYIKHDLECRRIERNEKIQALWDQGQRDVRMIATRFGLSCKQVRRIVDR